MSRQTECRLALTGWWILLILASCGVQRPVPKGEAAASGPPGLNLYRLVVAGRVGAPPPKLVVAGFPGDDDSGRIAPDGNWFAYRTHREGTPEIWIARKDGSGARRLAGGLEEPGAPSWSPDAKWIVFQARKAGVSRLFVASPSAPGLRELPTPPEPAARPQFSPDGKNIYFIQQAQGAAPRLARIGFDGTGYALVREGVDEAAAGADGSILYFSSAADSGVFRWPVSGGKAERVIELGGSGLWSLSREALFVVDLSQRTVVRVDLKTGHRSTAFPLPANYERPRSSAGLDVSADETWYLLPLNDNPPAVQPAAP